MAVCPLILNFLHISSQKWLVFANYFCLPNFSPQLANILHGYIRHIRDIFQLWCICLCHFDHFDLSLSFLSLWSVFVFLVISTCLYLFYAQYWSFCLRMIFAAQKFTATVKRTIGMFTFKKFIGVIKNIKI